MRLFKLLLTLVLLVFLFLFCLFFVVSNPTSITVDLLVPGSQLHMTLGSVLLLTLVLGLLLGVSFQWLRQRLHLTGDK